MALMTVYRKLLKAYGKQGWWPTTRNGVMSYYGGPVNDSERLEVCFGAILTQNTSWNNAEKAIRNMHELIDIEKVSKIGQEKLAKIIKSSGFHNQKSERLKMFCSYVLKNYGSLERFFANGELRKELLSLKGIGNETADSIMLYAADRPVFVIDAYTKRIFSSLGFLGADATYDEWQQLFEENLKHDVELFKEYHALIVEHAKRLRNGSATILFD